MNQFLAEHPQITALLDIPQDAEFIYDTYSTGITHNGKTIGVYAKIGKDPLLIGNKPYSPSPQWNRDEIKSWGHLFGHSLGGAGGYTGRWNLIPQLLESNALQRTIAEEQVYAWLKKGRPVEVLICPRWQGEEVVKIDYFLRPKGKQAFSMIQIPNTCEGMTEYRKRITEERKNHRSSIEETIRGIR
jgi:hypothetical protein